MRGRRNDEVDGLLVDGVPKDVGRVPAAGDEEGCALGEEDSPGRKSAVLREPEEFGSLEELFSATDRNDFSNTFHNLIVLSEEARVSTV